MNLNTMLYWHKLEHFYPYILEEQHNENIKTYHVSKADGFPDFSALDDIPKNKAIRYYEVYFGIFKVDSALEVIAEQLNAQQEFRDESDEVSCFCKFRLTSDGSFDKSSFRISSFPWAVQRVNNQEINLEDWDEDFHRYEKRLYMELFEAQSVITYPLLNEILIKISEDIGWKIEFAECWMRIDRVIGDKKQTKQDDPSVPVKTDKEIEEENASVDELVKANDLLNSFFARDLEKIISNVKSNNYGVSLDAYVEHNAAERINIEADKEALFEIFDPSHLPYGKWPNGYPARSMQQVAVNISMDKQKLTQKICSVNGPPGTGKTFLLKDIIAANLVERALLLSEFERPDDVFTNEIGTITYKGFDSTLKDIDNRLKEYGILVASNNNAAVKNITIELPKKSSLKSEYKDQYTYFDNLSNRILDDETWGICAAALGNRKNCAKFMDEFWPIKPEEKEKFKFNKHLLKLHTGDEKRTPAVCEQYWKEAKSKFIEALQAVQAEYGEINACYQKLKEINGYLKDKRDQENQYRENAKYCEELVGQKEELQVLCTELDDDFVRCTSQMQEIRNTLTFFRLRCLLQPKNEMIQQYRIIEKKRQNTLKQKISEEDKIAALNKSIIKVNKIKEQLKKDLTTLAQQIADCENLIEPIRKQYQGLLPDDCFLSDLVGESSEEERKAAQDKAPWNGDKLTELREKLFLEAMNLHKAFVENSPQMRVQLDTFNKMIRGMLTKAEMQKFSGILFQSFMLVVPVISTTFASVGSFLKNIGKEEFGLVLIDEAGQAFPQSAPGAIWRAKKVIAVGDPLQIEPVVTIHDTTMEFLKRYFKQTGFIACKETSVQSLADEANAYVGSRSIGDKDFFIGSPLIVHGRCQRKIFNIANKIAYNGKMIYGTKDIEEPICDWIDVQGQAVNKHFVRAQAERILPIVKEAFLSEWKANGVDSCPSLFIISPFRSVKSGVIRYLRDNDYLYRELCVKDTVNKKVINSWIYSNIGTVHTFQGREATTVIICLGVDSGSKGQGAIQWASSKPNILNVAVTRAKEKLYIVGDVSKWANQDFFMDAYKICTKDT